MSKCSGFKICEKKIHNKECDPFCTSNILTDYLLHHHSLHFASLPATTPLTVPNDFLRSVFQVH